MKAIFLSDLHLRDPLESNSQTLLLFLSKVSKKEIPCTHLFLVGDIFDLWIENHDYFIQRYATIISEIRNCIAAGIFVHYFEGNHDLYLNKFWQQDVGAQVHDGPSFFQLGPWEVRVEHGDQMNPKDTGYLFLRWFLRTPLMVFVARYLPGSWVNFIGQSASSKSRSYTSSSRRSNEQAIVNMTRKHAELMHRGRAFDFIFTGHTHVRDIYKFQGDDGSSVQSINLGSWYEPPKYFYLDESAGCFVDL